MRGRLTLLFLLLAGWPIAVSAQPPDAAPRTNIETWSPAASVCEKRFTSSPVTVMPAVPWLSTVADA